ncbi:Potassium efflux system KefA protein / Small-conductance mechanosensitive channel [hydrothermal vent metagenome]|uniref:Potassium efflux system KefA protein / Small-conductance mechanosensitive channel n=1 Tax=hydrothermal vent metagenome TaxID=652676 RepID=A0A3B0S4V7_9ZZZZ
MDNKYGQFIFPRIGFNWTIAVLLLALVFCFLAASAKAVPISPEIKAEIVATERLLSKRTAHLAEKTPISDEHLVTFLDELRTERTASLERIRKLTANRDATREALTQAQPVQVEGEPPVKADPVAARKLKPLQAELTAIDGLLVRANLNASNAEQLAKQISTRRKSLYLTTVFRRSTTPLSERSRKQIVLLGKQIVTGVQNWSGEQAQALSTGKLVARGAVLLFSILGLLVLASPLYGWFERRFLFPVFAKIESKGEAGRSKFTIASVRAAVRAALFAVPALGVYFLLRASGVIADGESNLIFHILLTLCGVVLADGIALGILSPMHPKYRIALLSNRRARNYRLFGMSALWVFAFDHLTELTYSQTKLVVSLAEIQAQSAIVTLIAATLVLFAGIQAPLKGAKPKKRKKQSTRFRLAEPGLLLSIVRLSAIVLALFGIVSSLLGYVELGRTLVWTLILIVLILAGYILARHIVLGVTKSLWKWLWFNPAEDDDEETESGGIILTIWVRLLADITLVVTSLWIFFTLADFRISDLDIWASRLTEGIPLGAVTIRPMDIAWAGVSFFVVLLIFRGLHSYLRHGMEGEQEIDAGANASVLAIVGYIGFIAAVFVGFGALGLPLDNIALIAGALSVGIGFGLQSVVNNFVSGLILLFERPINTGDWVITGAGDGLVSNIGLRSTEITTFDNATILVPNSDLISAPLTNWTHREKSGRVRLQLGVAYGSDPEQVREILLKCADEHKLVLKRPAPFVYWQGFGASSLDFELRAFVRNIKETITIETDLRFAVFAAIKAANIEIPFPQHEVRILASETPKAIKTPKKTPRKTQTKPGPKASGNP